MLAPATRGRVRRRGAGAAGPRERRALRRLRDDLGVELRDAGTLLVARDRDDAEALDRLHAFRGSLGLDGGAPAPQRGAPARAGAGPDASASRSTSRATARWTRARWSPRCARACPSAPRARDRPAPGCGRGRIVVAAGALARAADGPAGPVARSRARCCARDRRCRARRALDPHARAPTWSRAATAATCSARRWRSAAGTRR